MSVVFEATMHGRADSSWSASISQILDADGVPVDYSTAVLIGEMRSDVNAAEIALEPMITGLSDGSIQITATNVQTRSLTRRRYVMSIMDTSGESGTGYSHVGDVLFDVQAVSTRSISGTGGAGGAGDGLILMNLKSVRDTKTVLRGNNGKTGDTGQQGNAGAPVAPVSAFMTPILSASDGPAVVDAIGAASQADIGLNLFPDGGAFKGGVYTSDVVGSSFIIPGYVKTDNGAVFSNGGDYALNSSSFGGSGPALTPEIKSLIETMNSDSVEVHFRYQPAFCALKIDGGSAPTGTPVTTTLGTAYWATLSNPWAEFENYTLSVWVLAKTGHLVMNNGQLIRAFRDGVEVSGSSESLAVEPSDGWVHFCLIFGARLFGYHNSPLRIMVSAGGEALVALPALVAGKKKFKHKTIIQAAPTIAAIFGA